MLNLDRQKQAKILRLVRKIHRFTGVGLFLFLFSSGITGLLLGWKKNSMGLILAETSQGVSKDSKDWLPIDLLIGIATKHPVNLKNGKIPGEVDRIEIRPDKGIVKINYKSNYKGLQIDATTGKILMIESRNADLIEHIHDGSFFDKQTGNKFGAFKLFYTSLCGLGLITFCITGFWMWYGPKKFRKSQP